MVRKFFDPFEELKELTLEMDQVLESIFRPSLHKRKELPGFRRDETLTKFIPAIEMAEENDNYITKIEIPGVSPEDIEILITPEYLSIKGEVKGKKEEERKGYYYSEFNYGSFKRTITFPTKVDDSQAKATFKDGILEVKVPKVKDALLEGRKLLIDKT